MLLVSILIPCHNAEPWLEATLESALAQTWKDTEIIVVDDGSRDQSLAIARRFESRGVQVISQPNSGASAARNRAIGSSRGALLQFLDADDLLSPDKIATQVALLAQHPPGTLASCAWGRFTDDPAAAQFVDDRVFRDFAPMDFLVLAGLTGAMMHPSAWLVPRTLAEQAGPWNEELSLNDDGEYFSRVVLASRRIVFCPGARSFYRSRLTGSLSQQRGDRARRSQYRSIQLIERHLLAAENTPRVETAIAGYYTRFVQDFYPAPAELIRAATRRVNALGGRITRPAMGPKTALAARFLGWKNVWRLRHLLSR